MPVYEYECSICGHKFSLRRNFNDKDEDIKCPHCNVGKPKKLISLFSTSCSSATSATSGGGWGVQRGNS